MARDEDRANVVWLGWTPKLALCLGANRLHGSRICDLHEGSGRKSFNEETRTSRMGMSGLREMSEGRSRFFKPGGSFLFFAIPSPSKV